MGELGRPGDIGVGAAAAHGVDQVVVADRAARRQRDPAGARVDPRHGAGHQPHALGEDLPVVHDRGVGPAHQLVQPDAVHKGGTRVDQGHGHVVALRQPVRRHDAGVPAADHHHVCVLSHDASLVSSGSHTRHRVLGGCDRL